MADLNTARTFDPSDPQQLAEREKQLKNRALQQEKLLKEQLAMPAGRNYYWDQLSACHIFEGAGPLDEASANFFLGERNVGLRLLADIMRASPDALVLMLKEQGNG